MQLANPVGLIFLVVGLGYLIGFGPAGGLLATGLTIGYPRTIRPTLGRVPGAAMRSPMCC